MKFTELHIAVVTFHPGIYFPPALVSRTSLPAASCGRPGEREREREGRQNFARRGRAKRGAKRRARRRDGERFKYTGIVARRGGAGRREGAS